MKTGILAIQFWENDKKQAMDLARLIADIEPARRDDIDFVFIARHDCTHDDATAEYVSRKFNVRKLRCMSHAIGHPHACWVLWFSLLEWYYHSRAGGKIPEYKWIFPFEADCVPMHKDWINQCDAEFDKANSMLLGAEWLHGWHHANGNMMVRADLNFLKWLVMGVTMSGVPPAQPWDVFLFPQFVDWGVGFSEKFLNAYARRTVSRDEYKAFQDQGLLFLHGTKDDSARHWSRTLLI